MKENERKALVDDISKNPTIPVYTRQVTRQNIDTTTSETVTRTTSQIQNPKMALLEPLDAQIASLRQEKIKKDSMLLGLRPIVKAELGKNVGFLDELDIMYSILGDSGVSLAVWLIFFLLLFAIEVFVLVSKWNEAETDYDVLVRQQEELHRRRLELLARQ